ncbi:MAG TPA: glycosyltransferase [Patescibacteria group bacterium]|nr:glycosyltransferase [Patescibacteria group bacterium]
MSEPYWIIVPFINAWEMTSQAIRDFLGQTGLPSPPQVLAIDNGSRNEVREAIDQWAANEPRLHVWHHRPGLPSLSASWNAGLDFVWRQGGEVALVANNDLRLHPQTYATLLATLQVEDALFVTAVGRREPDLNWSEYFAAPLTYTGTGSHGGPDFSCFLISHACHDLVQFDERHIPAYLEDCCYHREMMLGGHGTRIFSINVPYLHYASGTINQETDPKRLADWARRIEQSRAHYRRCWGGDVNAERYMVKGDPTTAQDGATNPDLQRLFLGAPPCDDACTATVDSPAHD